MPDSPRQSLKSPKRDHITALIVVFIVHTIIYGWLLLKSGGVPYVMDGNESYCTWWHAYSLNEFPLAKTCGLANEALSRDLSAQAVVHTHQGNWPRIPAALLYWLGIKSLEGQIAVTTFLVGGGVAMLIFSCFARIFTFRFGLLVTGVFLTDYILFAQWQLNTYRIWQHFFFFSALYCALRICDASNHARWWISLFGISLAMFYCELTFAVFVSVTVMLWILLNAKRRWAIFLKASVIIGSAAAVAGSILIWQLILYYGVDGLQRDIQVTFFGRNFASAPAEYAAAIEKLNAEHMVASFYTISDGRLNLNLYTVLHWLTRYGLAIYSPAFGLGVLFIIWGATLRKLLQWCLSASWMPPYKEQKLKTWKSWILFLSAAGTILVAPPFVINASLRTVGFSSPAMACFLNIGWPAIYLTFLLAQHLRWRELISAWHSSRSGGIVTLRQLVLACGFQLKKMVHNQWLACSIISAIFLLGCWTLSLCFETGKAADPQMMPLWRYMWSFMGFTSNNGWCDNVATFFLILAFLTGWIRACLPFPLARHIETRQTVQVIGDGGTSLARFYVSIAGGLVIATLFSPGYVFPGYVERYCVLLAYPVLPLVAIAIWILVQEWTRIASWHRQIKTVRQGGSLFSSALTVVVRTSTAITLIFWFACQAALMHQLPLDYIRPIKDVIKEYVGSEGTIVIDDHGTALIYYGVKWAYRDPSMGYLPLLAERNQDRQIVLRNSNRMRFVWFADAAQNKEYDEPRFFLHFRVRTLETASANLAGETTYKASELPIVKDALGLRYTGARVLASDPSGRDEWVLLVLDWVAVMPVRSS